MKPNSTNRARYRPSGQSQETDALDVLVRKFADEARGYVRRKLGLRLRQRLDSEDVLQEAFLEAVRVFLRDRDAIPAVQKEFLPWIEKVIENKIGNLARHHGATRRSVRREESLEARPDRKVSAQQLTPSKELAAAEGYERLLRAIEALPRRQRDVVKLVHVEKLRVSDAARRMGKTPNSTSVLLHQALKRLREILEDREK